MLFTIQNTGTTVGLTVLFTEVVAALGTSLPGAMSAALTNAGAPQLAPYFSSIPPTIALFAAFLGYNPMKEMIARLPIPAGTHLNAVAVSTITSNTWFPDAIAQSFMGALHIALYLNAGLAIVAAIASLMRGSKLEYDRQYEHNGRSTKVESPIPIAVPDRSKEARSRSSQEEPHPNALASFTASKQSDQSDEDEKRRFET
jgi:hypothetical protein